jgi:hypothetical protein
MSDSIVERLTELEGAVKRAAEALATSVARCSPRWT